MTEWERVYACLAELEGECGDLLQGQDAMQEIMLMEKIAKLYVLLDALERRGCLEP